MTIVKKQNPTALYPGSSWSTPVRIKPADGADGTDGTNGADGYSPAMLYRGVYNQKPDGVADVLNYFGNEKRVDCVKYNGTYYIARVDAYKNYTVNPDQPFNGILPTNSNYWNTFGAQLDSIATGLLLAELAYVENLIVGRLSTGKDDLLPRLLATGIEIGFYLNKSDEDDMSKAPIRLGVVTGQMGNGANKPGFLVKDVSGNNSATEVSSEGIFTNGSDINRYDAASAIQSCNSLVAFLEKRAPGTPADKTLNAAIVGIDNTETNYPTIPEIGLGGYFNKLMIAGLYLKCRRINETMTSQERVINEEDVFISMYNAASTSIFLSLPQTAGKILFIRINSSFGVTIDAYSNSFGKNLLLENGSVSATKTASTIGELITLVWDGNYWLYSTTAS
jgi:hypothetical protein